MGSPMLLHSLDRTYEMLQPWRPDELGFIDFLNWHSLSRDSMPQDEIEAFGEAGGAYGAYLIK
jgi:hypothetical protein